MYEVSVEQTFAAGHALRNYHGKCENVHGHNYRLKVTLAGTQLDAAGLLVDFTELKSVMQTAIERLDHQFINNVPPFDTLNPSAENMAKYFYDALSSALDNRNSVRVSEVKLWETEVAAATYRP